MVNGLAEIHCVETVQKALDITKSVSEKKIMDTNLPQQKLSSQQLAHVGQSATLYIQQETCSNLVLSLSMSHLPAHLFYSPREPVGTHSTSKMGYVCKHHM